MTIFNQQLAGVGSTWMVDSTHFRDLAIVLHTVVGEHCNLCARCLIENVVRLGNDVIACADAGIGGRN